MNLRIAITGAQGTGKSTFATDLESHLRSQTSRTTYLLPSMGKGLGEAGLPLGMNATLETIYAFAALHLEREMVTLDGITIFDRCLLDLYAYAQTRQLTSGWFGRMLSCVVRNSLSTMDYLFYVPIPPNLAESTSVNETSVLRANIDQVIRECGTGWGIPLYDLQGDREQRLHEAILKLKCWPGWQPNEIRAMDIGPRRVEQ